MEPRSSAAVDRGRPAMNAANIPINLNGTTVTLVDGTQLPDCRPDLLNIGDLMARGWSIFPVQPRSKVPAVKWECYQRRLATVDELEKWFTKPGYNVGIVTGKLSGIFVVDADSAAAE